MEVANLIERLNIMSGMLRMGERIAFGSDADALEEAATALRDLQKEVDRLKGSRDGYIRDSQARQGLSDEYRRLLKKSVENCRAAICERDEARKALEPFANVADMYDGATYPYKDDEPTLEAGITMGDLRRARAALGDKP